MFIWKLEQSIVVQQAGRLSRLPCTVFVMLVEFLEELEVDVQIFRRRGRGICARVEIIGTDSVVCWPRCWIFSSSVSEDCDWVN